MFPGSSFQIVYNLTQEKLLGIGQVLSSSELLHVHTICLPVWVTCRTTENFNSCVLALLHRGVPIYGLCRKLAIFKSGTQQTWQACGRCEHRVTWWWWCPSSLTSRNSFFRVKNFWIPLSSDLTITQFLIQHTVSYALRSTILLWPNWTCEVLTQKHRQGNHPLHRRDHDIWGLCIDEVYL